MLSTNTWADGSPRSQSNAFNWQVPKEAPTAAQKRKAELNTYQRQYISAKRTGLAGLFADREFSEAWEADTLVEVEGEDAKD